MSQDPTELNMIQLRKALQQAAATADEQIAHLKECEVSFEVADDVGHWIHWVLRWPEAKLTDKQRSTLADLDALTDRMSGRENAHLWTNEALRSQPEWDEVRRMARKALKLFGWQVEDTDVPRDERDMLKQALRVAALPADQQVATFPPGSPVAHWIAGDFFNCSGFVVRHTDTDLTVEQQSALIALYSRLDEMSARHERDTELWTEEGLRGRPEWSEVRREASNILALFK